MKNKFFLTIFIALNIGIKAQENSIVSNYEYSQFKFIGYNNEFPVYQCNYNYDEPIEGVINFAIYSASLETNGTILFSYLKEIGSEKWVYFAMGNKVIFEKAQGTDIYYKFKDKVEKIKTYGSINIYRPTHYLTQKECFYFSTEIRDIDYLARIDLKQENPKMEVLPIKGRKPIIYNGWLFYEIDYMSPKYSDPPDAIYRVKIGDWRNPELIVNDVYFGGTVINENLISFRVYEKEKIRDVTCNITEKTYVEIDIDPLIKYKDKYYQNTLCKDEKTGKTQICYTDVPELPDKFPHEFERQVEPNQNFLYLPHTQKPFAGTFITDSLMFFANKEQLKKLSKPQLRKLRNAFYAKEGFDFDSKDLNDFFSQFQWYIKTLEQRRIKNSSNDDIYIPPMDMNRINLIKSVENMK